MYSVHSTWPMLPGAVSGAVGYQHLRTTRSMLSAHQLLADDVNNMSFWRPFLPAPTATVSRPCCAAFSTPPAALLPSNCRPTAEYQAFTLDLDLDNRDVAVGTAENAASSSPTF